MLPQPARFRLGRRLGSGGFAEVYEAERLTPSSQHALAQNPALPPGDQAASGGQVGDRVALKRLLPALRQDPVRRRHLIREAQLSAQLWHPNIVRVLDLVDLNGNGEPVIEMELVDGVSASQLLSRLGQRSLRLTLGAITHIMHGLLAALGYLESAPLAGQRPLVHADISLENVMITAAGEVKILDFGVAGLDPSAPDDEGVTSLHQVAGKRAYAPPEHDGPAPPSVAGDVYAAGVCLWELHAGWRYPVLPRGVGGREVGSLVAFAAEGLPEGVWKSLARCLSVDPAQRPGTAQEAMELLSATAKLAAAEQGALGHLARWARAELAAATPAALAPAEKAPEVSAHPRWQRVCEVYDPVVALVDRLHFAFCAHRVAAYEPVAPEEIESMGGHEFILRAERGAAGEQVPDYTLREAMDRGTSEEPDGTLLFQVRWASGRGGAKNVVVVVQPGAGCVYDDMARRILSNLLRP